MTLINSLVTWFNTSRMYQIDILRKHPENVQRETLFKLLNTARNTEFGRSYNFQSIGSENEYKSRLPLQSYDDLKPYVDKLRERHENIL
jgi:hypothetical protein